MAPGVRRARRWSRWSCTSCSSSRWCRRSSRPGRSSGSSIRPQTFTFQQPQERLQYIAVTPPKVNPEVAPRPVAGDAERNGAVRAGRTNGESAPDGPTIPTVPLHSPRRSPDRDPRAGRRLRRQRRHAAVGPAGQRSRGGEGTAAGLRRSARLGRCPGPHLRAENVRGAARLRRQREHHEVPRLGDGEHVRAEQVRARRLDLQDERWPVVRHRPEVHPTRASSPSPPRSSVSSP